MTAATPLCAPAIPTRAAPVPRLHGDLAVWLIILAEMLAFGIFFLAFAFARLTDVAAFNTDQALLDRRFGAINTALLISASACVVAAVDAVQADRARRGLGWLLAAGVGGVGFAALKLLEYSAKWAAGIDLSTSTFFMFYFLLTGFHFFHVLAGLAFLAYAAAALLRHGSAAQSLHTLQTAGAFWHMVDLLWIVLFPLVYGMR